MAADSNSQGWSIWEAIGGLRANVQRLIEGQQRSEERLDQGLKENSDRLERGLKETNRRIDRLLFAVIALIGGVTATLVLQIVGN